MRKRGNLNQILKSTRLIRTTVPISFILLTATLANKINIEIILLSICCILLYASGGILNAKIDKDFKIRNTKKIFYALIATTIILSLYNKIIFTTTILWIILSLIYNKYSRRILLADTAILSLTHAILPILATALLLNLNQQTTISLAIFSLITTNLIFPMKNISGIKEDKKRKYQTLPTKFKSGEKITIILLSLSVIPVILIPQIFKIQNALILFPLILYLCINLLILSNKKTQAYEITRLLILAINFTISTNTKNIYLLTAHASILAIYLIHILRKWNTTTQ